MGKKVLNLTNSLIGTKEMLHLFSYNGIITIRIRRKEEEEEKEEEAEAEQQEQPSPSSTGGECIAYLQIVRYIKYTKQLSQLYLSIPHLKLKYS